MSHFEIASFTPEMEMPDQTAEQIADLFARNYPSSHSKAQHEKHLVEKLNASAIQNSIEGGATFYVASVDDTESPVVGFLQARTLERKTATYEGMAWIMTAEEYRGQRVASLLHRGFLIDGNRRANERRPKRSFASLNVHPYNPARGVYTKWGYRYIRETDDGMITMAMLLPVEVEE